MGEQDTGYKAGDDNDRDDRDDEKETVSEKKRTPSSTSIGQSMTSDTDDPIISPAVSIEMGWSKDVKDDQRSPSGHENETNVSSSTEPKSPSKSPKTAGAP